MALKETEKDINAASSLKQPTMTQLGGVEYNLKKQPNGSRWQREKFEKGNERQQYRNSLPAREDDTEKKGATNRRAYYVKENQGGLTMQQGRLSPMRAEQTQRTLAGGGFGQNPPGLQVSFPSLNLGGSFGGGHGGGGYGGQQHGIPPPSFKIQGPQNVNLGFGQNLNLGLGQNFNLGLGQDINIRGPNIPLDLRICPDIILSLIVLGAAAAAVGLYLAIIGVGRRKKRSASLQETKGRLRFISVLE